MTTETNPFLLGVTLKDLDSNVRSEISYLDRNLTSGMNTHASSILQNSGAQSSLIRDQLNRSTDYLISDAHRNTDALSGTVERQNIQAQTLSDSRFKDLKDVTMRGTDFGLNDARRNADFVLNDSRRNSEFLSNAVERTGMANLLATKDSRMDVTSAIDRSGTAAMLATKDSRMDVTNSVDRNGAANGMAIQTTRGEILTSIEHSNVANNLNSYNLAKDTTSAVERNGVQNALATERNAGLLLNETIRGQGQVRDLVNHQASEARNYLNQLSAQSFQLAKEAALSAKETDLKVAEASFRSQQQGSDFLVNLGRMKSDIEKQASDHAALAARDMALLTRDVLLSKGEIMKQSSDNTASLQLEALKNKDALSNQLHCTYEKLSALNTDRIRDNLDDYRAEYTGMKYGDFHRGHIHNNLHSHMGREGFGREGFGREGR